MAFCDWVPWANSEDPDQNAPMEQSDQGLQCLLLSQLFSNAHTYSEINRLNF